jgi:hypothetical protein
MSLGKFTKSTRKFITPRDGVFTARIIKAFNWLDLDLKNPKVRSFMEEEKFGWVEKVLKEATDELKALVTIFYEVENDIYKKTIRASEWVDGSGKEKSTMFKIERIFEASGAMDNILPGDEYEPDFKDITGKMVKIRVYQKGKYSEVYDFPAKHDSAPDVLNNQFMRDEYLQNKIAEANAEAGTTPTPASVPSGTPGNGALPVTPAGDDEPLPF